MATGSPVSFWYGTRAQYDSITTKLDTTLYFITDEQALYKGAIKFSGSGVDTLLSVGTSAPTPTQAYDKYFNTSTGLIYVLSATGSTVSSYTPANGALYYNADSQRFITLTFDGSAWSENDIYDAGMSVADGTGLYLNGTTVGGLDATTSSKGVVQIGNNITVSNGTISVPVAASNVFGVVKIGDNITNNSGTISIAKATASSLGVVKVGSNISVDASGSISVPVATDSALGVMFVSGGASSQNGVTLSLNASGALFISVNKATGSQYGTTKLVTGFTASNLADDEWWEMHEDASSLASTLSAVREFTYAVLDNLSVGLSVDSTTGKAKIADASTSQKGVVQLVNDADSSDMSSETKAITPHAVGQVADGLTAEINLKQDILTNATNAGDGIIIENSRIKTDIATVEEVVTGETGTHLVDADGLTGALSLGQANDVSCCPAVKAGTLTLNGQAVTDTNYLSNDYPMLWTFTGSGSENSFGFYGTHPFPKFATNRKYLFIADITVNSGSSAAYFKSHNGVDVLGNALGKVHDAGETFRLAMTFTTSGADVSVNTISGYSYSFNITNCRQYAVTGMSDEAIKYLASAETNPNPDALFRSTNMSSVISRYLIKQNMVSPWMGVIGMKDNSDMTVAAGSNYKIKYTDNADHTVSVDTFPNDAYGWDSHIQMFVKGTSHIIFKSPLILMNALTPNAGHNLVVKYRNGQALVYVEDTDAGNIVYLVSGSSTTQGSLAYGLAQTPTTEDATYTNYVVFGSTVNGLVCDAGTMSNIGYSASLIGNGDDTTFITGTLGFASGKSMYVQDLNLKDIEITSGSLNIGNNVKITGATSNGVEGNGNIVLEDNCLLDFSDQANNVPITAFTVTAVDGARAIPYGETESEAIVAGTGNAVNKYGKCGYLVSDASATASNTLYDALVGNGSSYSNVIFDPALNEQTVNLVAGTTISRHVVIAGNGTENTVIGTASSTLDTMKLADSVALTIKDVQLNMAINWGNHGAIKLSNVLYKDLNVTTSMSLLYSANSNQDLCYLTGSTFSNVKLSTGANSGILSAVYGKWEITDCEVSGCTITRNSQIGVFCRVSAESILRNCTFTNNYFSFSFYGSSIAGLVDNCSFTNHTGGVFSLDDSSGSGAKVVFSNDTLGINIRVAAKGIATFSGINILGSTVFGAGTAAFVDGATVTSTIPSGSTIGTGVISCPINIGSNSATIENITITGVTYGSCFGTESGASVILNNVEVTGNTFSELLCISSLEGRYYELNDCWIHANANSANGISGLGGVIQVTNSRTGGITYNGAIVVFVGNSTVSSLSTNTSSATGTLVLTPGSTVTATNGVINSQGTARIVVGTYDKETGTVTEAETGSAVAIVGGTSFIVSGNGTYINPNSTPPTDLVLVSD
jgi:hypothetical protein